MEPSGKKIELKASDELLDLLNINREDFSFTDKDVVGFSSYKAINIGNGLVAGYLFFGESEEGSIGVPNNVVEF